MFGARLFANPARQTGEFSSDRRKLIFPRTSEGTYHFFIRSPLNGSSSKNRSFTAGRLDILFQPLKVLVCLFISWEDIDRILDRHRPELLQFTPDTNAQICRPGWQLMNQQNPLMTSSLLLL